MTMSSPSGDIWVTRVLQAKAAWPLTRMAQEPQMALRQEHLSDRVPSMSSRMLMRASRTVVYWSTSTW